jgi:hypothetical protein
MSLHRAVADVSIRIVQQFGSVNTAYAALFARQPPSRAAVGLSGGAALHMVACRQPRAVLHVQSVSHWAPACIGPYAQAVSVRCVRVSSHVILTHRLYRRAVSCLSRVRLACIRQP